MSTTRTCTLNGRRIEAANALRDADAHLEALRTADGQHFHGVGGRPVGAEEMAAACRAREQAEAALNAAAEDLDMHSASERIEAEDAAHA